MSIKIAKKRVVRSTGRSDDADAFIRESDPASGVTDDLALHLAEEYLRGAASGGNMEEESPEELLVEEMGGAFIESRAEAEFGGTRRGAGTDADIQVEPSGLPEAVGPLAIGSLDDAIEATGAEGVSLEDDDATLALTDPEAEPASHLPAGLHPFATLR